MITFRNQLLKFALLPAFLLPLATVSAQPATQTVFVAFDIETTGLSTTQDRIVEIAAVRFQNGQCQAVTNWLINPQQPIPTYASRVHGITDSMVASAPKFAAVYPAFCSFIQNAPLLAHNARFDIGILAAEIQRGDLPPLNNIAIDTLTLARDQFPKLSSHSLEHLATTLTLPRTQPHRACSDAITVMHLMHRICDSRPPDTTLQALLFAAGTPRPGEHGASRTAPPQKNTP